MPPGSHRRVGHRHFIELGEAGIKALAQPGTVLYDVKSIMPFGSADGRLRALRMTRYKQAELRRHRKWVAAQRKGVPVAMPWYVARLT